ncbi:MAG: hypothetical protein ACLTBF_11230 [Christensenellales bacterium]
MRRLVSDAPISVSAPQPTMVKAEQRDHPDQILLYAARKHPAHQSYRNACDDFRTLMAMK